MFKKIFVLLLVLIVIFVYKNNEQNIFIPNDAIRLRVIPNSNNPEDIYIKEKVKKYLEENIYNLTKYSSSIADARYIISQSIPEIDNNISNIFKDNKYPFTYNVNFGYNYFPEKMYKGVIYDEGYYESLVISIGNAEGDNWWCVLFPNFCLIDTKNTTEYKSYIKEIISKYSKSK